MKTINEIYLTHFDIGTKLSQVYPLWKAFSKALYNTNPDAKILPLPLYIEICDKYSAR